MSRAVTVGKSQRKQLENQHRFTFEMSLLNRDTSRPVSVTERLNTLPASVQNGSGAHPASYPMGIRGSFRGGKAAGA